MYHHEGLNLTLMVYVDDFKMAGPKGNLQKGWNLIRYGSQTPPTPTSKNNVILDSRRGIVMGDPEPLNLCLGCHHKQFTKQVKVVNDDNYNN